MCQGTTFRLPEDEFAAARQLQPWDAFNPEPCRATTCNFRQGRIRGLACSGRFGPVLQRNPYPGAWWHTLVLVNYGALHGAERLVVYTPRFTSL